MTEPNLYYPTAHNVPLFDHSEPGKVEDKNLIVIHVTVGSTASGAISTFRQSVHPNRVSAHFVVDRDGTVFQLLPISDIAWHASAVNDRSIGIEHVAVPGTLPVTEDQYRSSAALIAWLLHRLKLPCDAGHILGHNAASPQDHHTLCPEGAMSVSRLIDRTAALMGFGSLKW